MLRGSRHGVEGRVWADVMRYLVWILINHSQDNRQHRCLGVDLEQRRLPPLTAACSPIVAAETRTVPWTRDAQH
jgi:hypothetical protein